MSSKVDYLLQENKMKKNILFLIAVLVAPFQSVIAENIHLIAVNGVAEKAIDPNMVNLQIEVWSKAATAKLAQETQAVLYEKVKAAVEKFKIKKDDFKTDFFSINPDYVYDQKTRANKITGYRVSHQITIIQRRTQDAGSLIDTLTGSSKGDSGAVSIQNISWDYDKKGTLESQTLAEAVKLARAKAEDLAQAAGVKIKAVHRIQNASFSVDSGNSNKMMFMQSAEMAPRMAKTELSSGPIKIHVNVDMEFEIQ